VTTLPSAESIDASLQAARSWLVRWRGVIYVALFLIALALIRFAPDRAPSPTSAPSATTLR